MNHMDNMTRRGVVHEFSAKMPPLSAIQDIKNVGKKQTDNVCLFPTFFYRTVLNFLSAAPARKRRAANRPQISLKSTARIPAAIFPGLRGASPTETSVLSCFITAKSSHFYRRSLSFGCGKWKNSSPRIPHGFSRTIFPQASPPKFIAPSPTVRKGL